LLTVTVFKSVVSSVAYTSTVLVLAGIDMYCIFWLLSKESVISVVVESIITLPTP